MQTVGIQDPVINDILFKSGPRTILLLEGEDDLDTIEKWYKSEIDDIYVHDCGGKLKVKDIFDKLELATYKERVFAIRDRDLDYTEYKVNKCYRDTTNRFYILKRRNLENYLIDPQSILDVIEISFAAGKRPVNTIKQVADDLKDIVSTLKNITLCNLLIENENEGITGAKPTCYSPGHNCNSETKANLIINVSAKIGKSQAYVRRELNSLIAAQNSKFTTLNQSHKIVCGKRILFALKDKYKFTVDVNLLKRQLIARLKVNGIPNDFRKIIEQRIQGYAI